MQELSNRGLPADVTLLQAIDDNFSKFYKTVQINPTQTKTKAYEYRSIYLLALKSSTMTNSTQFINLLRSMDSTLDEATSFDGFTLFSYVVREIEFQKGRADLIPDIMFADQCKAVSCLVGNYFDKDNRRL